MFCKYYINQNKQFKLVLDVLKKQSLSTLEIYQCFFNSIYITHYWIISIQLLLSIDINECSISNDGCEEICTNTNGSFICSCHQGYMLRHDKRTCTGINN